MSAEKVFLTYKRKRLSKSDRPAVFPLIVTVKHEDSSGKCVSEDHERDSAAPMKHVTPICIVATTSEPLAASYLDQPIVEGTIPNITLYKDDTVRVHSSNDVQKDACSNCFETSLHNSLEDSTGRCITGDNDIAALKLELDTGGEAQIMSSDGVKPIVQHENMSGEETNLVDFDSSVLPSDSCDMVDLNIMPDSCCEEKLIHAASETFWGSTESTCKKSETLQLLGTMYNKLDETLSSVNHTLAYRNACTFGEVGFICNYSEKASPSPVFSMHTTSMSKCLPILSDNKTREVFPLASTNQQAMGSSGKKNFRSGLEHSQQRHESLQRHKMMLDSIQNRPITLNQTRGQYPYNSKAYAGIWSEDELDYLWISVRRHGKENWDTLLRDPRLHFSPWRTSKQLSERWDEEQSMILGGRGPHTSHVRKLFTNEHIQKNWINVRPQGPVRVKRYQKQRKSTVLFSDSDGAGYKFGLLNQSNSDMPHWFKEAVIVPSPTTRLTEPIMPEFSISGDPESSKVVPGEASRTRCHVEKVDDTIEINSEVSSEEMIPDAHQLL